MSGPPEPKLPPRYRVDRVLGKGGMGKVYLAHDLDEGRPVALKVLHVPRAVFQEASARFRREARAQSRVQSRHVVAIYDQDFDGETPFIAMEYVEGKDLAELLKAEGALPWSRVLRVARELGQALDRLHAAGVLHRDLKPSNIMVREADGSTVLMDLGLARVQDATALTGTGQIVGTPLYMPPEILGEGAAWSAAADVYQVGAILFELLAGQPLLKGSTMDEVVASMMGGDHRTLPLDPDRPLHVDAVLRQAVAMDPDRRFGSAGELARALAEGGEGIGPMVPTELLQSTGLGAGIGSPVVPAPRGWVQGRLPWVLVLLVGLTTGALLGSRTPRDPTWEVIGDALVVTVDPGSAEDLRIDVGGRESREQLEAPPGKVRLVWRGLPSSQAVEVALAWRGGEGPRNHFEAAHPAVEPRPRLLAGRRLRLELRRPARVYLEGDPAPVAPSAAGPIELAVPPPGGALPALLWEEGGLRFRRPWTWEDVYAGVTTQMAGLPGEDDQDTLRLAMRDQDQTMMNQARLGWADLTPWVPEILASGLPVEARRELQRAFQCFQRFEFYEGSGRLQVEATRLPPAGYGGRPALLPKGTSHVAAVMPPYGGDGIKMISQEVDPLARLRRGSARLEVPFVWPAVPPEATRVVVYLRVHRLPLTWAARLRVVDDPEALTFDFWSPDPARKAGGWLGIILTADLLPPAGTPMVLVALPLDPRDPEYAEVNEVQVHWAAP